MSNLYNLQGVSPLGFKAGAAIAINTAVKLGAAAGEVVPAVAIGDVVIGFALQPAAVGDLVSVQPFGKAKAVLGANVAFGAQLMPQAAGNGAVVTAAGAAARTCAMALEAGNAGETIAVLLTGLNLNGPLNA